MVELLRKDQKVENTWDLESMFKTNEDFWNQFKEVEKLIPEIKNYRGKVCSPHNDLKEYKINKPIYKEHDAAYYDECIENLAQKNIFI